MAERGRQGGLILGIESSCDETAAAVVRAGGEVLANVVASQMKLHANYGGVVPELASREHLRNIVPVVRAAMDQAGLKFADLDAIAVTEGPGLAGALLVGITYAKALALGAGKPLVAVNHLEGHIHAVLMETGQRERAMEMPLLALVVSGGHTHLYLAETRDPTHDVESIMNGEAGVWRYRNVGRTVDDAAGEAFDKVAKLLGLGYPGGPWIDALAKEGDPRAVEFKFREIKPRPTSQNRDGGHPDQEFREIKPGPTSQNRDVGHPDQEFREIKPGPTSQNPDVGHPDQDFREIKPGPTSQNPDGGHTDQEFREIKPGPTSQNPDVGHPDQDFREIKPRPTSQNPDVGHPDQEFREIKPRPTSQNRDVGHPERSGRRNADPTHAGETVMNGAPGDSRCAQHFDFSFSGIKTAVLRYIQTHGMAERVEARRRALAYGPGVGPAEAVREMPEVFDRQTLDLIASFQYAVVGNLMRQTFRAAEAFGARGIVVSGGVAANRELRRRFSAEAERRGLRVAFPTLAMSTDNAAMIAAAAWGKFVARDFAGEGLVASPQLRLGRD